MEILNFKIKISVLWIFMAVAVSAHGIMGMMEPDLIEQLISGEMQVGPAMSVFMALFWLIPLIMAYLSLSLKDGANRWSNMILGIIFVVLNVYHFIEHLAQPSVHQILIIGSTVVVAVLIFWHALKWPRKVM